MEHRSSCRVKSLHRVYAEKRDVYLGCFYATNMGGGGAFISGRSADISKGDIVTIVGYIPREGKGKPYRMSAMVVHVGTDGIGLMWIESDSIIQSTLADILPAAA